jgi:hypothetical protein
MFYVPLYIFFNYFSPPLSGLDLNMQFTLAEIKRFLCFNRMITLKT